MGKVLKHIEEIQLKVVQMQDDDEEEPGRSGCDTIYPQINSGSCHLSKEIEEE